MNDIVMDDFQKSVANSLIRHKSILDLMTKSSEVNSRTNRAIIKAVSRCGCIRIHAERQQLPDDASLDEIPALLKSQIDGELCDNCCDVIKEEIGAQVYYIAALCDALDLNLYDVLQEQYEKIKTLGKFSLL